MSYGKSILLCLFVGCNLFGSDFNYSPFSADSKVEKLKLSKLSPAPDKLNFKKPKYSCILSKDNNSQLNIVDKIGKAEGWYVELILDNKVVIPSCQVTEYCNTTGGISVYSGDINSDKIDDFVIYLYSGGCGLAAGHCNVAFLLSLGDGKYKLRIVKTLFPDEGSLTVINNRPYFIATSLGNVDKCKDRKSHNFWIHNLLGFKKGSVKVDNSVDPMFPKTIFYTLKPNHSETTIITQEDKDKMVRSKASIFIVKK